MLGASVALGVLWTSPCGLSALERPPWAALWVGPFHGLTEGLSSVMLSQTHQCLLEPHHTFRLLQTELSGDLQQCLCSGAQHKLPASRASMLLGAVPCLLTWQKEVTARRRLGVVAAGIRASVVGNPW